MKNFGKKMIAGLCAMVVSSAINANSIDNQALSAHCNEISDALFKLHDTKQEESCSGDVLYAGGVMAGAGGLAQAKRYDEVRKNLRITHNHLNRTWHAYEQCPFLSFHTKPYLDRVASLIDELKQADNG